MTMPPHDRVPPPPHEAHGPGMCLDCGLVVTMHYTGRCRRCGDWCESIPASELLAGDWFFDGMAWTQVSSVETNDDGNVEVVTQWDIESVHSAGVVERKSRTTVRPTARVWVAAHQRPKVGVLA